MKRVTIVVDIPDDSGYGYAGELKTALNRVVDTAELLPEPDRFQFVSPLSTTTITVEDLTAGFTENSFKV